MILRPPSLRSGSAQNFNGSSSYLSAALNFTQQRLIGISFWLYWTTFANNDALAMEYSTNYNSSVGFIIDPNSSSPDSGSVDVGLSNTSGVSTIQAGFTRPSAGAWHHWLVNYNAGSPASIPAVYIDGVSQTLTTHGSMNGANLANNTLYVMSRAGASLFGTGRISDLAFFDGNLGAAHAGALYRGLSPAVIGQHYPLRYYWILAENVPEQSRGYSPAVMTPHSLSGVTAGPYQMRRTRPWLTPKTAAGAGAAVVAAYTPPTPRRRVQIKRPVLLRTG